MEVDLTQLSAPFDKRFIETVRKGNRSESYVNHAVVTGRLNRVLGVDGWEFRITQVETYNGPDGAPHVAFVVAELSLNMGVRRQEIGVPSNVVVEERKQGDRTVYPTTVQDEIKTAVSDALKRCAMRFGVAIQLWHEVEPSEAGGSVGRQAAAPAPDTPVAGSEQGLEGPAPATTDGDGAGGTGESTGSDPSLEAPTYDQLVAFAGSDPKARAAINAVSSRTYKSTDVRESTDVERAEALAFLQARAAL